MHEIESFSLAELAAAYPPRNYPAEPKRAPTFAELAKAEPRLGGMLREAQACHADHSPAFCANAVWYGYAGHRGIKPRLLALVGWERDAIDPLLSTCAAYDVAYDTIYEALPDCRGECRCSRML